MKKKLKILCKTFESFSQNAFKLMQFLQIHGNAKCNESRFQFIKFIK